LPCLSEIAGVGQGDQLAQMIEVFQAVRPFGKL
jgi:hypothetical protein